MSPFTVEDLYLNRKATELECSDHADFVIACVKSADRAKDSYVSALWCFPLDGKPARQLTFGPGQDNTPRLSPDAKQLAFISNRSGGMQVQLMSMSGGEARQAGNFPQGVSQLEWAPDGKNLVVSASVAVDPDLRGARAGAPAPKRGPSAPEVCWRLPYKSDGVGYLLAREVHLFSLDIASGEAKQLTDGPFDVQGFCPSPNGRHIAYSRSREGRFAHRTDLWVCDADGTRHRCLTQELATVMTPSWSPDGRWIAFAGARREGDGQSRLWLLDFASGKLTQLGPDGLEVADPQALHWSSDSQRLFLARAWRGRHEIVAVCVADGGLEVCVGGPRQFGAFAAREGHFAFVVNAADQAEEIFACEWDGSHERAISELNPWWHERTPLVLEDRSFEVPDGRGGTETIQGWLLRPRDAKRPMPLFNDMHGGPASYALLDYDTNPFWQPLCSRGWAVLMLNAVGSSSFGPEFCERLAGHWGSYDLPQHLEAVRQLQREGLCDDRVTVGGKSYGGFLTAWAIGHTDLFRAAVVMAPVGNIETHYGTSDGGYYADPLYLGTAPAFNRELAEQLSPLKYVERAATPTLFMQGKDDERCPKCQSEELFVSMYRAGDTPTELILYPGGNHHFLGDGPPSMRQDASRRVIDWLARHAGRAVRLRSRDDEARGETADAAVQAGS